MFSSFFMRTTTPTTTLPRAAARGYNAMLTSIRSNTNGITGSGRICVGGQLERKPALIRPILAPSIMKKSLSAGSHHHHHPTFSALTGASFRNVRSAQGFPTLRGSLGGKTKAHPSSFSLMSTHHGSNPIQSSRGAFAMTSKQTTPFTSSMMIRPNGVKSSSLPLSHHVYQHQLGAISHFSSSMGGGGAPPRRGGPPSWATGAGFLGAATVLFGKTKYVLAALKMTKLASLGSMVLTIGAYSIFFGWPYAVGVVGLIMIHETGHALVMLHRGIPFSPMVFIPFMGAVIVMNKNPRDAWEDALVALGGPVLGSLGAAVVAVGAHATQSQLLFALADFGFMVNLFNMLPIGSMDGGRIAGALSPYAGVAGLGLGGLLAYQGAIHNPIFYVILLLGGWETFQRFYNPHHLPPNYYKITATQRAVLTVSYFGLIAALIAAMDANQRFRKPPEVLVREARGEISWDYR